MTELLPPGIANRLQDAKRSAALAGTSRLTGFSVEKTDPRAYKDPEYASLVRNVRNGIASPVPKEFFRDPYVFGLALGSTHVGPGFTEGIRAFISTALKNRDEHTVKTLVELRRTLEEISDNEQNLAKLVQYFFDNQETASEFLGLSSSKRMHAVLSAVGGLAGLGAGYIVSDEWGPALFGVLGLLAGEVSSHTLQHMGELHRRIENAQMLLKMLPAHALKK